MRHIFIILFIPFFLLGCDSKTLGIQTSLYNEGKEIVQMTSENVNSGQLKFTNDQIMKIDDFKSKYSPNKLDKKEKEFYQLVFWTYVSYMSYGDENESQYMDKYHESLDKIKTKFNIDVD